MTVMVCSSYFCEGKRMDIISGMVCYSYLCHGRTVCVMAVMMCWIYLCAGRTVGVSLGWSAGVNCVMEGRWM